MIKKAIVPLLLTFFCVSFYGCISLEILKGNGTGNLGVYLFEKYSKKEINSAIKALYVAYPQYVPPGKYKKPIIHRWTKLDSPESYRYNNDTVQFHFYLKITDEEEILYWTSFGHLEENWTGAPSKLCLLGYAQGIQLMTRNDFKSGKQVKENGYIRLFELEVLPKIVYFLKHPVESK